VKKTIKKSLAFLLSALMVISMLPAFAITAFADGDSNAQAFLTSKATFENGITSNGVTWNDAMDAAYFNGSSSVKLNGSPLQNVTQSSGFIVSMDVYNVDNSSANKYFNFTNGDQFYGCEGSSADWWTRYRSQISNGSNTRWYYTSDLNNADYTTVTSPANGNDSYPINEWYTFTLAMNSDGSYSYYRNCELLGTYKSDYISTSNGGGLTNESAASVIAGLTDYYIGAANAEGSEGFTGYIKNVRFYDEANSANILDIAISEYENKMNGSVYTNMGAAYNAYVAANEALNSNANDAELAAATTAIIAATNNMTEFTAPTANAVQSYSVNELDGSTDRAALNSVNLISSNRNSTSGDTTAYDNTTESWRIRVYYAENVLLYDGTTQPMFPVEYSNNLENKNKSRYTHTVYPASSLGSKDSADNESADFELYNGRNADHEKCWVGNDGRINYSWTFSQSEKVGADATNSDEHYSSNHSLDNMLWTGNTTSPSYYVNAVRYIGTPTGAIDDFQIIWAHRSSGTQIVGPSSITSDDYGSGTASVHTYVYNYKGIHDLIASKAALSDVDSYKDGGLETLFSYCDALTQDYSVLMSDINSANSTYATLKTYGEEYTITFVKADTTSTTAKFIHGTSAADVAAAAPSLPANHYDEEKHYTYAWDAEFADVTGTATYTQVETAADHDCTGIHTPATATTNGYTTHTCDCGYSYVTYDDVADLTALQTAYSKGDATLKELAGKAAQYDETSVNALIAAVNSAAVAAYLDAADKTVFNKEIHQDTIDALAQDITDAIAGLTAAAPATEEAAEALEVYEAAVKKIGNLDPDAYDKNSDELVFGINTANTIMENGTVVYEDQTINVVNTSADAEAIEDATSTILTALSKSYREYTITTVDVDHTSFKNGTVTGESTPYTASYGTEVLCISNDYDTAWFLEVQSGSMHKELSFQGYGYVLRTKIMGNTTIKAVKRSDDKRLVKIERHYDNEAPESNDLHMNFADYVDAGSSFDLPAAPAYAYYTFDGYYIGEEKITASSITVNEDTTITALYKVDSNADCAINATDIDNNASNSTVAYNTKVTLEGGEGAYAWVEETAPNMFRPFFIGQNVTFYASESITLTAVSEEQFNAYNFELPCVNLRQSGTIVVGNKVVFNAQVVAENMENVKEYGILVGTGSITNDDLIVENSGQQDGFKVLRAKSTKLIQSANQFTISVSNLTGNDYIYRGYVIYEDGTSLKTVYTDIYSNN
jgi:hypothetical protein